MFQYRKRYEITCDKKIISILTVAVVAFQYRKRYEITCDLVWSVARKPPKFCFNTASGMRSHVTLCLGGRRNRRLKTRFWKTSSKPNMRSHIFSCHYIPRDYVITPPRLVWQGLQRFEENRKTCPVFSPLRGFPLFIM